MEPSNFHLFVIQLLDGTAILEKIYLKKQCESYKIIDICGGLILIKLYLQLKPMVLINIKQCISSTKMFPKCQVKTREIVLI